MRAFCLSLLALAAFTSPAAAQPSGRAQSLFNGRTLDGWTPVGGADWFVRRGQIGADGPALGFLVSRGSYRDFELTVEFWVGEGANSGLFLRCADRTSITLDTAYEVNIFDRRPDQTYASGALVNIAAVAPSFPRTEGRWNRMVVTVRSDRFDVVLNGVRTVQGARDPTRAEGPIALQYGAGQVRFRRVEIRRL